MYVIHIAVGTSKIAYSITRFVPLYTLIFLS